MAACLLYLLEALCHWALLSLPLVSALENNGLENRPPSANSQLYLRHPAKPLAARRPKVPPTTSYTFALFSLKTIFVASVLVFLRKTQRRLLSRFSSCSIRAFVRRFGGWSRILL